MSELSIFQCPHCGSKLLRREGTYSCGNLHTYDIAKEGYVNLLPVNQRKSKAPGDNKEMMRARRSFLDQGYFKELSHYINALVMQDMESRQPASYRILDAGCGEGYYSDALHNGLIGSTQPEAALWGMDISKEAVRLAAKRNKNITFFVGSSYHIPIASNTLDCSINIFAPFKEEEMLRILKEKRILIKVTPGARHLFGLKEDLYDNPYFHEEELPRVRQLKIIQSRSLTYELSLDGREDIHNLLKMTPYYWNTNQNKTGEFLSNTETLNTLLDFVVTSYGK
jgi:23S rRNA (guanine745-N1)-methyltransferase